MHDHIWVVNWHASTLNMWRTHCFTCGAMYISFYNTSISVSMWWMNDTIKKKMKKKNRKIENNNDLALAMQLNQPVARHLNMGRLANSAKSWRRCFAFNIFVGRMECFLVFSVYTTTNQKKKRRKETNNVFFLSVFHWQFTRLKHMAQNDLCALSLVVAVLFLLLLLFCWMNMWSLFQMPNGWTTTFSAYIVNFDPRLLEKTMKK